MTPCSNCGSDFRVCQDCDLHNGKYVEISVLEDIKAEISRKANSGQWSEATVYGMQKAITIIDSYISGKEQDK